MIVALAGGVGGAKLALGLSRILSPADLSVVVNTGDDFEHLGLHVSPDIDTVTYTLAGIANPEQGWGIAGETWSFMDALRGLGGETWFRLGDRDLATHVERTRRLRAGVSLSDITVEIARSLGIEHSLLPMSDDAVRTIVLSGGNRLGFQDYFVRQQCAPIVDDLLYEGAESATPSHGFAGLIADPNLAGVVVCPSNPFLSIGPMLAVPGVRRWLERRKFPVVAVSPIIAGAAVKGPAAKILAELGQDVSSVSVAAYYRGLIDILLMDDADREHAAAVAALGITPAFAPTLMRTLEDRERVAAECLSLLRSRAVTEPAVRR
jgi:LPPG:FO 2-phospho-L-lactate transferase